jgi:CO/xanthine dehydrogenase Mo-binding subunit
MSLGQPITRLDGPAKVTGKARFTADTFVENVAHAQIVAAPSTSSAPSRCPV